MELLRITAMLMVVALHASTGGFGYITAARMHHDPAKWVAVTLSTMTCIGCVDLFVLLTGWFGTRFKWRGVGRLVSQTAVVSLSMYAVVTLLGADLPRTFLDTVKVVWGYWFVRSYLLLYVLSPLLNAFIEQSDEKRLGAFLLAYYAFFIPYSLIDNNIGTGYNTMSFIGLYMLARYLRLYGANRLRSVRTWTLWTGWLAVVALGTLIITLTAQLATQTATHEVLNYVTSYSSVLVVSGAVLLLLAFSRLSVQKRWVNWLAAGSFTVYLTHQQLYLRKPYTDFIKSLIRNAGSPALCSLAVLVTVLAIFLASVCFDALRRYAGEKFNECLRRLFRKH